MNYFRLYKTLRNRFAKPICLLLTLVLFSVNVYAQVEFPQQPIKLILPFPTGSGTDGSARVLANTISSATGFTIIVENKVGANGFMAAEFVAKSKPDGYNLLLTSNTHIANKFLYKKLPYEPTQDFKSITLLKEAPLVLVVSPNSPFANFADLNKKVKQSPGVVSFASGNSSSRVAAELYSLTMGSKMLYVPYKGNPNAISDLISGRVDILFADTSSVMSLVKSGQLRALATTGLSRLANLKEVPTSAELGFPQVNFGSWLALLAPSKTSNAITDKLNTIFNAALQSESVKKNFALNEAEPKGSTPSELDAFLSAELIKWSDIISKAGIQAE
jgi:tripartite-type tricarboxylate transporter receptor subunit TctC